jgi:hypothetical protein
MSAMPMGTTTNITTTITTIIMANLIRANTTIIGTAAMMIDTLQNMISPRKRPGKAPKTMSVNHRDNPETR